MELYLACLVVVITTFFVCKWYLNKEIRCVIHEGICTKIATTSKQCDTLIKELESYKPKIVGFDIEWSSKKEKGQTTKVSLIQLGHKNIIILIRLNLIKHIPGSLHDFLGNVEILKTGIGIYEDKQKLYRDYKIDVNGCIDINHIFKNKLLIQTQNELKTEYYNINNLTKQQQSSQSMFGLNSMSQILLKQSMKYKNVKYYFHEKWNDHKLTIQHIHYAADDALIGYKLFIKLIDIISTQNSENDHSSYLTLCFGIDDPSKIEKCVVCGNEEKISDLLKYHIVPTQYFKYMNVKKGFNDNKDNDNPTVTEADVFAVKTNSIWSCRSCKKLCNKSEDTFREFLCTKYNISGVQKRQSFIKVRTGSNAMLDTNIRYKLPINIQINILKDLCNYFNFNYEIIYKNDDKNDKNDEYKWQWYNSEIKEFMDYSSKLSNEIESAYIENKEITYFKVIKTKKNINGMHENTYKVDFNDMEQQNIKSKYKRGMRRIYKNDQTILKQYEINKFDHLIKITNCDKDEYKTDNNDINLTTNEIIINCIDDIIKNGSKSVSSLQREQFKMHSKRLFDKIKNQNEFIKLWKQNFIDTLKPKHYKQ